LWFLPQWTDSGLETDGLSQPDLGPEEIQQLANDARIKAREVISASLLHTRPRQTRGLLDFHFELRRSFLSLDF
jgi:hypothetical protein